jgi:segregation and condensation protein A
MEKQGENNSSSESSVTQEQVHDLLFSKQIDWQEIIYDLINTEQLNPWDINIIVLTDKYFQRIQKLEEADFFISSKVLYAASLLLRIKSEILLNKYVKSIDDILFGRKEEIKKYGFERIELDEDIPELIPRSPLPRFKKVTLKELLESLNKAITTENRRIKKEIVNKNALIESSISLPRRNFSLKDKISEILNKLSGSFDSKEEHKKISFSEFTKRDSNEMLNSFSPLLHLENQKKIWLEQKNYFEEIYIWEKESYWKHNGHPFQDLMDELKNGTYKELSFSDEEFEKFGEKEEEFAENTGKKL